MRVTAKGKEMNGDLNSFFFIIRNSGIYRTFSFVRINQIIR